jgi:hypothetical protein
MPILVIATMPTTATVRITTTRTTPPQSTRLVCLPHPLLEGVLLPVDPNIAGSKQALVRSAGFYVGVGPRVTWRLQNQFCDFITSCAQLVPHRFQSRTMPRPYTMRHTPTGTRTRAIT